MRAASPGFQRQCETVGVRFDHRADLADADQRCLQGSGATLGSQRPLRQVCRPEAAVEATFDHARQVHLRTIVHNTVARFDFPAAHTEPCRRVEVGVQRDKLPVQACRVEVRISPGFAGATGQRHCRRHSDEVNHQADAKSGGLPRREELHQQILTRCLRPRRNPTIYSRDSCGFTWPLLLA